MRKLCPWCGRELEVKTIKKEDKIEVLCANCKHKLKEYKINEEKKTSEEPVLVIKDTEKPSLNRRIDWRPATIALGLVILVFLVIRFVLI